MCELYLVSIRAESGTEGSTQNARYIWRVALSSSTRPTIFIAASKQRWIFLPVSELGFMILWLLLGSAKLLNVLRRNGRCTRMVACQYARLSTFLCRKKSGRRSEEPIPFVSRRYSNDPRHSLRFAVSFLAIRSRSSADGRFIPYRSLRMLARIFDNLLLLANELSLSYAEYLPMVGNRT